MGGRGSKERGEFGIGGERWVSAVGRGEVREKTGGEVGEVSISVSKREGRCSDIRLY